jgi:hypothetical protein
MAGEQMQELAALFRPGLGPGDVGNNRGTQSATELKRQRIIVARSAACSS